MKRMYRTIRRPGPPPALLAVLVLALRAVALYHPRSRPKEAGDRPDTAAPPERAVEVTLIPPQTDSQTGGYNAPGIHVYDPDTHKLLDMSLEEYVVRVVAAEMPASYESEALKAQAVAARTLTVFKMQHGGCTKAEGADVCADHGHCQAYCSEANMREKWGDDTQQYLDKILLAVTETEGQIICYQDDPIEVFYHAQSAGATERLENVFSGSEPYLISVSSTERVEPVQEALAAGEVARRINSAYPKAGLSAAQLSSQIEVTASNESGRVSQVRMGNVTLTGVEVRRALGLRSAQFTVSFSGDTVVFTTFGYGHGVGMSQAGAQDMAQQGEDYIDILTHYYPGTSIQPLT